MVVHAALVPGRRQHALRVLGPRGRWRAHPIPGRLLVRVVDLEWLVHVAQERPWHSRNEVVVVHDAPERRADALRPGRFHVGLHEGRVAHPRLAEGPDGAHAEAHAGAEVQGRQGHQASAEGVAGQRHAAAVQAADAVQQLLAEICICAGVAVEHGAAGAPGGAARRPGAPPDQGVRHDVLEVEVGRAPQGGHAPHRAVAARDLRDEALDAEPAAGAKEALRPGDDRRLLAQVAAVPCLNGLPAAEGDPGVLGIEVRGLLVVDGASSRHAARREAALPGPSAPRGRAA
mmetsp:Transcript_73848/g.238679  ORF Transcript_73848/g.238679 Transcript_73848/m.238679 type:complete len:288 (+) Transcript_73848:180-1043(+)